MKGSRDEERDEERQKKPEDLDAHRCSICIGMAFVYYSEDNKTNLRKLSVTATRRTETVFYR